MALQPDYQGALVALNRFGYGPRGGDGDDLAAAASDPRGFVRADMLRPQPTLLEGYDLPSSEVLLTRFYDYAAQQKIERERAVAQRAEDQPRTETTAVRPDALPGRSGASGPAKKAPNVIQLTYRTEAFARFRRACLADSGFCERLVAFWANHFAVSVDKGPLVRIAAGAFEREAIRPHVFGRFADMLRAVEQHPVMLNYLDNQLSIGPNSRAGRNRKRGLNENLARETMELHTIGVNGGYTQADVTSFAKILTGWTIAGPEGRAGPPGTFVFFANAHEPGPQTLLGKTYPDSGRSQGEAALDDLARHPSTANFIGAKLARHFVADDPPPALVAHLARTFARTDGDLRATSMALIDAEEAWRAPLTKMRSPYEFMIASTRLFGRGLDNAQPLLGGLELLGMPLWAPPGPNGFPDSVAAWASPEGLKLRLDIADRIGRQAANAPYNPSDLLQDALGPAASNDTREAVARAESKEQGFALLLMSPEMQRR